MKKRLIILSGLLVTGVAQAHSGHGLNGGDSTLLHYLSEPEHVAALVLLVAVVAGVSTLLRRRKKHSDQP